MNSETSQLPIGLKVRCIDGSTHSHTVLKSQTINSLKSELSEKLGVDKEKIRLIFQGRHLKDEDTVEHYKIDEGHVIHLILGSKPPVLSPEEAQSENDSNIVIGGEHSTESGEMSMLNSVMQIIMETRSRQLSFQQESQNRTRVVEFRSEDFKESLAQNLHTVGALLKCRKEDSAAPKAFDWSGLSYSVGQWVDAQDTTNQWLEAQIIAVEATRVSVHYNGCGQEQDEWIPSDSPRLALFRSHTIQSPEASLHSPFPQVPVDAPGVHPISESSAPTEELIDHLVKTSSNINSLIKDYLEVSKKKEEVKEGEKLEQSRAAQLAPLVDRIGRMYTDMGAYFSSLAYRDQTTGTEIQAIPRLAEPGSTQIECQFGVPPNPSQINELSRRPRAEPAVFLHEVVLDPANTVINTPPTEYQSVEIQTDSEISSVPVTKNEESPKLRNSSSSCNPEEVDLSYNDSSNKENMKAPNQ